MTKKERYAGIINYFSENFPEPETELAYNTPFELLVAVILSAQCTDKRVNLVTPNLFRHFPDAISMARTDQESIFELIKSISFPNNKAKHLLGMANLVVHEFNNKIPDTVKDLEKLPGVGRKTANVIASVIHNKPTMAVDTHVFRVSHRVGLVPVKAKNPLLVETELVKNISDLDIPKAHHWLILHGRYTCVARNPKCGECTITQWCKSYPKIQKHGIKAVDSKLPSIN